VKRGLTRPNNILERFYAIGGKQGRRQPHGRALEQHGADPAVTPAEDRATREQKAVRVLQH